MHPPDPPPARDPGFEAALADRPADATVRAIYADWLDDHGQDRYAAAHRWLAAHGKHPLECDVEMTDRGPSPRAAFFGYPHGRPVYPGYIPAVLPQTVFETLRARAVSVTDVPTLWDQTFRSLARGEMRALTDSYWVYFPSPQVAVEELAEALADAGGRGLDPGAGVRP